MNTIVDSQKASFQQKGVLDVRPFLDSEDGGSLDQENLPPLFLLAFVVVLVLAIIFRDLPQYIMRALDVKVEPTADGNKIFVSELMREYTVNESEIFRCFRIHGVEVSQDSNNDAFINADNVVRSDLDRWFRFHNADVNQLTSNSDEQNEV
jgi:hypothetical protein